MKKLFSFRSVVIPEDAPRAVIVMALLAMLLHLPSVRAFPPAQDCLIYGVVKDQYPDFEVKNTHYNSLRTYRR